MLAVVPFSAIRGEYLKFNERITWPFSKRRATDVNTIRCNEIVKRVSFCMSLWRQPLAVAAESQYVPFTTHFGPRPLGSPGLPLAFGPRVDCQRIGEAVCKQGH